MKIKMNLYISDTERFARSPFTDCCYSLSPNRNMDNVWMFVSVVELDLSGVDNVAITEHATAELDEEIGKHTAAINNLENRKAELLALPSPS